MQNETHTHKDTIIEEFDTMNFADADNNTDKEVGFFRRNEELIIKGAVGIAAIGLGLIAGVVAIDKRNKVLLDYNKAILHYNQDKY